MPTNIIETSLKKINVKSFRKLKDIEINLGQRLTCISGKNGTSKSTILGIAAQIFSFEKNYENGQPLDYKTLFGAPFKSQYSEHFRFSLKHDDPKSLVSVDVYDAYAQNNINGRLSFTITGPKKDRFRPVLRQDAGSRNFTHPVIYLNLKRLLPITERAYKNVNINFFDEEKNKNLFNSLFDRIQVKQRQLIKLTATDGGVKSIVATPAEYDEHSVSVGEDNIGQIIAALLSFKNLSENYPDYHGGLLLIDEIDAALFPAAQEQLIEVLKEYADKYNLQVIFTSHSTIIMKKMFDIVQKVTDKNKYKFIYLKEELNLISVKDDYSWEQVIADINIKTIPSTKTSNSKISVLFEDLQAVEYFKQLTLRSPLNKLIQKKNCESSCNGLIELFNIPFCSENAIIILDGDQTAPINSKTKLKNAKNIFTLPTILSPDQLHFFILHFMREDNPYWNRTNQFTKEVFRRHAIECRIYDSLINLSSITDSIDDEGIDLNTLISLFRQHIQRYMDSGDGKKKMRKSFKQFSMHAEIKDNTLGNNEYNVFRYFHKHYAPEIKKQFLSQLEQAITQVQNTKKY